MYYLLENNMILSDKQCNKYINYEDRENDYVIFEDKENGNITNISFGNNYVPVNKFYSILKIIKKSENVFDLIEVGDLIAFEHVGTKHIDIAKVCYIYQRKDGDIDILTIGYLHENEKIQAIYKPNSKGDYIKVWERNFKWLKFIF